MLEPNLWDSRRTSMLCSIERMSLGTSLNLGSVKLRVTIKHGRAGCRGLCMQPHGQRFQPSQPCRVASCAPTPSTNSGAAIIEAAVLLDSVVVTQRSALESENGILTLAVITVR